jgi:hypothetical protein
VNRCYVFYLIKIPGKLQGHELRSHNFHNINNNIIILLFKCDFSRSRVPATHILPLNHYEPLSKIPLAEVNLKAFITYD